MSQIDWIYSKVEGKRVLDLGCFEESIPVHLSREGYRVTVICLDEGRIAGVRKALDKEPPSVRERIDIQLAQAGHLPLEQGTIDTVLLAHSLEHVTRPGSVLDEVRRVLASDGRALMAVPLGVHPGRDQKRIYYPLSLFDEVSQRLRVNSVEIKDKYILLVAEHLGDQDGKDVTGVTWYSLLEQLEKEMLSIEISFRRSFDLGQEQAKDLAARLESTTKRLEESVKIASESQQKKEKLVRLVEIAENRKEQACGELEKLRDKLRAEEKGKEALEQTVPEPRNRLQQMSGELMQTRRREGILADRIEKAEVERRALEDELRSAHLGQSEALRAQKDLENRISQLSVESKRLGKRRNGVAKLIDRAGIESGKSLAVRVRRLVSRWLKLNEMHEKLTSGVRFKVGDAVVRAARPSLDTLKLPLELARLFVKGLGNVRHRSAVQKRLRSPEIKSLPPTDEPRRGPALKDGWFISRREEETKRAVDLVGWGKPRLMDDVRACVVLDEFSEQCFGPECRMIRPRPDNWEAVVLSERPHLLFVESAWKGNSGSWQYRVGKYASPPGKELHEMIAWFRRNGLPTVFWNKEDPVHFEKFVEAARLFDLVMTSDGNCRGRYVQDVGHDRVSALPFAAQPRLHNPVSLPFERKPKACFAGSYYSNRHEKRREEMEMLLDAASEVGLDVYDRNFGQTGPGSEHFRFPKRFREHIVGRLPYRELVRAYKCYRVFLNVNSVVDSPTMFSRRVFELLACGTPVVSTPSLGIEEMLGNDVVWMVRDPDQAREALDVLIRDDAEWRRRRLRGIRAVLSGHTYRRRFSEVLRRAGVDLEEKADPQVLLIARVKSQGELGRVLEDFRGQTWKWIHLLVLAEGDLQPFSDERTSVVQAGECNQDFLEKEVKVRGADLIGLVSPDCVYGRYYVEDLVYTVEYSGADMAGKSVSGSDLYRFNEALHQAGCLYDIKRMGAKGWMLQDILTSEPVSWSLSGARTFSADGAGFVPDFPRWDDENAVAEVRSRSEI